MSTDQALWWVTAYALLVTGVAAVPLWLAGRRYRSRGRFLDHQCRRPWLRDRPYGERWECHCGRVWFIAPGSPYASSHSHWRPER